MRAYYFYPDCSYIFVTRTGVENVQAAVQLFCHECGPLFDTSSVVRVTHKSGYRDHYILRVSRISVAKMCVRKLMDSQMAAKIMTPEDASITLSRERVSMPRFSQGSTRTLTPGLHYLELATKKRVLDEGNLEAFLGKCRVFVVHLAFAVDTDEETLVIVAVHTDHRSSVEFMVRTWNYLGTKFSLRRLHPLDALTDLKGYRKGLVPDNVWHDTEERALEHERAKASRAEEEYFDELDAGEGEVLNEGGEGAGRYRGDAAAEGELDEFVQLLLENDPNCPRGADADPVFVDCAVDIHQMFRKTDWLKRPVSFNEFMRLLAPQCPRNMCVIEILGNPGCWKMVSRNEFNSYLLLCEK